MLREGLGLTFENIFVRRIQPMKVIELGLLFPKLRKKMLKNIGHPIPARAHISK